MGIVGKMVLPLSVIPQAQVQKLIADLSSVSWFDEGVGNGR